MSKERELLKEFIDFVDSYEFYPTERNIIWEIVNRANAILAQPETLSEDEIVALWANKSPANEFECVRLVEKAHGIGGGEC